MQSIAPQNPTVDELINCQTTACPIDVSRFQPLRACVYNFEPKMLNERKFIQLSKNDFLLIN